MYCIYGLLDPDTLELRYIGKTNQPEKRLKQHVYPSQIKTKTHRNDWIKSLLNNNKLPSFIILEREVINADEAEIRWIAEMREAGARLVNGTYGGDGHKGGSPLSEETKKRIGDAHRGQKRSEWMIENMKASQTYEWAQKRRETKMKTKKPNKVSGFVGVSLFIQNGKWRAYYMEDRKQKHIGYFETPQEAAQAYDTTVIMRYPDAVTNKSLGLL